MLFVEYDLRLSRANITFLGPFKACAFFPPPILLISPGRELYERERTPWTDVPEGRRYNTWEDSGRDSPDFRHQERLHTRGRRTTSRSASRTSGHTVIDLCP
ncbi:hypothetical protein Droror1_Dr00023877 [Drosera rotundifolia]